MCRTNFYKNWWWFYHKSSLKILFTDIVLTIHNSSNFEEDWRHSIERSLKNCNEATGVIFMIKGYRFYRIVAMLYGQECWNLSWNFLKLTMFNLFNLNIINNEFWLRCYVCRALQDDFLKCFFKWSTVDYNLYLLCILYHHKILYINIISNLYDKNTV